ncbi:Transposon Ty3-I Gag-Pol polyprotein [Vitis vinifera]|uniref:Transposon Ty3-I Gag-Pol polyprotein n=1 Tax=Vitis vinifera TaxID=29760 RepID=A0A438DC81_VITVI|nr:Transposon Ty3-I Gag-Pol polyprotein [Vitis vinifera]
MPLSRAFQKLMEGGLLTQLALRPVPQPVPPRFKMDMHCSYHQGPRHGTNHCSALSHAIQDLIDQGLVNLGQPSVTTNPLSTHSTHAVPPPPGSVHHIDFEEDDNIHMMSWDYGFPKSIVLDDGYEVDTMGSQTSTPFSLISNWVPFELTPTTPLATARQGSSVSFILQPDDDDLEGRDVQIVTHSGRVAQPPPLVARPFDGAVSHEKVRREDDELLRVVDWSGYIPILFQVLRIHTSFNLLLGRPWIHRVGAIPFSLHQKVKFIHDRQVITVQSPRDMFASSKPVLQIGHSENDLFLTGFTFDEVLTLEVEDFYKDFVAMSFDQHSSTMVLDMMRGMSFMPSLGLGRRQHGPMDFVVTIDHDTPFGFGFVPIEADYRYMAQLHKERVRARLACTLFDYPVHPYRSSLADHFIRGSELGNETSGAPVSVMIAHSSPDRANFLSLCFPDMSQIIERVQLEFVSPFNLFGVSTIEVVEELRTVLAPKLMEDVAVGDDLFEDTFSSIEGASNFVDTSLSFDILSGFISRPDDVYDFASMDLSILDIDDEISQPDSDIDSFNHGSNPIDERVSPATGDVEIVDFGTKDQPRELKIGSPLSINENDRLIHLLRSYLDVFAWSYEDMSMVEYLEWLANVVPIPKKDGKVRVCVDFKDLNKASPKDDFPLPHIDLLVDSTEGHSMLSFMDGFSGYNKILMALEDMEKTAFITKWGTYCYKVMPFELKNASTTYQRVSSTLFHDMMHRDVEVYVDDMIKSIKGSIVADHLASLPISEDRPVDDDFPDEEFIAMTSLSSWRMSVHLVFADRYLSTNNIVEYEACILGLEIALKLGIRQIELLVGRFDDLRYTHLPRVQNQFVDTLATLVSSVDIPTDVVIRPLLIESRSSLYRLSDEKGCGSHMRGHMLAQFQIHGDLIHAPLLELHVLTSPWSFSIWGIDIIRKISLKSSSGHEFILVTIDYFTKWVEAASHARLTSTRVANFIISHIICRYELPHELISDRGVHFRAEVDTLLQKYGIRHHRSSAYRPQTNGAVEATNKNIKKILRKMVETSRDWSKKLPFALWAYHTFFRTSTGATPYSLMYGMEVVLPVETKMGSLRVALEQQISETKWTHARFDQLNLLDEKRLRAVDHVQAYQRKMAHAFRK